ncbi:MacB family efflux pump subunit [Caulobacter segnis]|uniref:MacB family efflux pump subunit n=1 Tax=Caulobacter segnis TaxID=88688 RepID=UPI0028592F2B|nr:MacB family efflux pump subunit [Caulobacter segnis]MDR6625232.1 macrolide transport system ATP-binding/permease protein [Caulobacter segnis]
MDAPPLLRLVGARRDYPTGDGVFAALAGVDLEIRAGEMVAIVGASGSGKSTLMNILGCLDQPTAGTYQIAGRDTAKLGPDDLAALRRERFGFIFQRYHLLAALSAAGNVETPAIYAGVPRAARRSRARDLLVRLGLGERLSHRPNQLSGGQQQRVSIARALINGGEIILADEPTGALDSASGEKVMEILRDLHAEGHTIILVTHDMAVARHAPRIIEISDGVIVADRKSRADAPSASLAPLPARAPRPPPAHQLAESARLALVAMSAHKLRTVLTMLGVIIGIASVVSVVAIGNGSRGQIMRQISDLGTNTLDLYPGKDFGDLEANKVETLTPSDVEALRKQPYVDSVTPGVFTTVAARHRGVTANADVSGVGADFFRVRGLKFAEGRGFDAEAVAGIRQDVVLDNTSRKTLFPHGATAVGETIMLGQTPARVVGVIERKPSGGRDSSLAIYAPYTTVMTRMLGVSHLGSVTVRVSDKAPIDAAQGAVTRLITMRHGKKDFFISNNDQIRKMVEKTARTMTLLISSIAVISLVVGGIGVMNIMLVSVTERTAEIGLRMAVGARRSDILRQFLIEAVLICVFGGAIGVALALGIGGLLASVGSELVMRFSPLSIVAAFACSTVIGVAFGYLPARSAARLEPIDALGRV